MCIISTAQQASPKVIHISEPVRAQLMRLSAVGMRKPLSASSLFTPVKNCSLAPTGLPLRGSRIPFGAGATRVMESIPFKRPLLPLIYKSDRKNAKEQNHGPESGEADFAERDGPREQETHLEVEDNKQDGDEVVAHVELHARVVECVEAAFIGGEFFGVGLPVGDDEGRDEQHQAYHQGNRHEDDQRQIIQQQCAHGDSTKASCALPGSDARATDLSGSRKKGAVAPPKKPRTEQPQRRERPGLSPAHKGWQENIGRVNPGRSIDRSASR